MYVTALTTNLHHYPSVLLSQRGSVVPCRSFSMLTILLSIIKLDALIELSFTQMAESFSCSDNLFTFSFVLHIYLLLTTETSCVDYVKLLG